MISISTHHQFAVIMAASWYSQKTHLLTSIRVTLSLLLAATSRSAPLAFTYDQLNSSTANAFNFSGDAGFSQDQQHIQLTNYEINSLGRVIYSKLFHLWDINSGKVTDFSTSFSFTINAPNKTHHGDGIAFFLARPNFPKSQIEGSGIGLLSRNQSAIPNYTEENPFVAVEFDTVANKEWDPPHQHVGIDVHSINSSITTQWFTSMDGRGYDADVSYSSSSNILSVTFTGYNDTIPFKQHLSCVVNLRDELPDWVEFGFTSATGFFLEEHILSSWSFNSSLDFEAHKDETKTGMIIGLSVGGGVLICVLGLASFVTWKLRRNKGMKDGLHSDLAMDIDFERSSLPRKFSYEELARATNNFAKEHKIGEGGFGEVYKGFTRDLNNYVAIKKISQGSNQGLKEYASEVKIISRLRHKNLVQLIGWCHQQNDLLLVYEFVENGSLDSYLFKGKGLLRWTARYNIARGLASALLYLHEECDQCVLHRDIKSSNVMLDSNFNAKLGDFWVARLMNHEIESKTTVLAGTFGYISPEAATRGKASRESDVYSFGVVALEIASGRKAIEPNLSEEHKYLVDWVWELYGTGDLLKAADSRLYGEFNVKEVERLMIVGIWCTHIDYLQRPMIRQAVQVLNFDAQLPILSSKVSASKYNSSFYSVASKTPAFENNQTGISTSSKSTTSEVITPSAAWTYEVFLNFRGVDTRKSFTGNLYSSLDQSGIRTFFDDEELRKGEEITPALRQAIKGSRIFIAVFSKNYASSKFCLDELVMILEYSKAKGRLFLPVFYDVDPSQVRYQNGAYAVALAKHEERFRDDKDKVQKWRDALHQAANVSGWDFQPGSASEYILIRKIVQEVSAFISP